MPRRIDLPGAAELFRATSGASAQPDTAEAADRAAPTREGTPSVTGRVKHEEKITVYVSSEELLALEHLRLTLRGEHHVAVDRGRIVRAAIAEALADVAANAGDAALIRRLTSR